MKRTLKMGGSLGCRRVFFSEQSLFYLWIFRSFAEIKCICSFVFPCFFYTLAFHTLGMY